MSHENPNKLILLTSEEQNIKNIKNEQNIKNKCKDVNSIQLLSVTE